MDELSRELVDLAASVADGTPDWTAADRGDAASPEVIAQLRTIAEIARAHAGIGATDDLGAPMVRKGPWGPLEIRELVGSGRFGDVYRALDPALHRDVALKILRHPVPDPHPVVEEGRLAARVRHPNVITIYGALCVNGEAGIWMEFIHGRTLEAELAERGSLPAGAVRDVGLALCAALDAVHAAGCVHRDVKASNVMREHTGRIVLGDFGTGTDALNDTADRRGLAGTPAYLAPEIFDRAPATPQSDIYSLGVLLFRLATGTFPVAGRTLAELRASHARGGVDPQRPSLANLGPLARVIERAMHPDPARRFQTARAMAASLKPRASAAAVTVSAAAGVGLLAATAAWLMWDPRSAQPDAGSRGIAVEQIDPSWATRAVMLGPPVGNRIPCGSRESGREGLAICDLLTRQITLIKRMPPPSASTGAVLLPDTGELAYVVVPPAGSNQPTEIRIADPAMQTDRLLRTTPQPVWLHRWHNVRRAIYATEGTTAILQPIDGRPVTTVATLAQRDHHHDLSPDGTRVVLVRPTEGGRDLIARDVASGKVLWSLDGPSDEFVPVWTPDGKGLVFASDRDGGHALMFVSTPDGAAPASPSVLRHMGRTTVRHPAGFSADGTFYFTGQGPARTLFMAGVDLDQRRISTPRVVDPGTLEDTLGGDWSPDGRQIAYLRSRIGSDRAALVIRNTDGTLAREVPVPGPLTQVNNHVRWSPDSRLIAVLRGKERQRVLEVYDLRTGTPRTLLQGGEFADPRWHSSSARIDYADFGPDGGDGTIRSVALSGGRSAVRYDPDDARLIPGGFDRTPAGDLLMRVRTADGNPCRFRTILAGGPARDFSFSDPACPAAAWTGRGPWFFASLKPPQELGALWMVNAETGERYRVTLDSDLIFFLSMNPAQTTTLFTAGNPPPLLWALRGLPLR
jgi:Tol biopolymer transport system component